MDRWKDRRMDGQAGGWMDEWMDGDEQMGGLTEGQTDRHSKTLTPKT